MMSTATQRAYRPEVYESHLLQTWLDIAQRQHDKDSILMPALERHFAPGTVLELGAGVGQLSRLLIGLGRRVVSSDYAEFFVEHMRSTGLDAHRVDATNVQASGLGQFDNIFCQSITPFVTTDYDVVERSYRSTFETLRPGGRLIMIHAMEKRPQLRPTMARHKALAERIGFANVHVSRQQLLPSRLYGAPFAPLAGLLERQFAPLLGMRFYLIASRP